MNQVAILWSPSQRAFHCESLSEYAQKNMAEACEPTGWDNDYKLIALSNNMEEADKALELLRKLVRGDQQ